MSDEAKCPAVARHKISHYSEPHLRERLDLLSSPEPTSGCWLWFGARNPNGRPVLSVKGKTTYAHRLALACEIGRALAPEEIVCHRCDNPQCVNPAHLWIGTHVENQADKVRKGRQARGSSIGTARLSDSAVSDIKARLRQGRSASEVAREFGVVVGTIGHIKAGRNWRHVH